MKKWIMLLGLVIIGLGLISGEVWAEEIRIDDSKSAQGKVGIYFNTGTAKKTKLMVSKGTEKYTYNLQNLDKMVYFPLQMGNGSYSVKVYENTEGNKYRPLTGKEFNVTLSDPNAVYLQSVQEIDWDEQKKAIKISQQLIETQEKELGRKLTEDEKIKVLYQYIIEKIVYDYEKINRIDTSYLPNIDDTVTTQNGICYDYSSLFAAVLREQGIPTKMIKGYSTFTTVYHAWNEIYVGGKWVIVDSTTDAYMFQNKAPYTFEKQLKDYNKAKEL